jgi:hypothetical protein
MAAVVFERWEVEAADLIQKVHGPFRIPTLLRGRISRCEMAAKKRPGESASSLRLKSARKLSAILPALSAFGSDCR